MSKIIKKLTGKCLPTSSSAGNNNNDEDIVNTKIRYHGPYRDSSGEQFFLPREWKRTTTVIGGGSMGRRKKSSNDHHRGAWKESLVNYNFDKEMNGTELIKNLNWLGRTNELMDKAACMMTVGELDSGEDESDDIVGEEDEPRRKRRLVGSGSSNNNKRSGEECMDERELRRALPDMANMLNNWTLHRQNLGSMLANYRMQSRCMKKRQRNELGHFFNTTSNVLDTIGSMVENTITKSVEFQKGGGGLVGGSSESKRELSNKPPPVLFPNRENLSRYATVFPGYSIDKGNMLTMEPNVGNQLFTLDYPRYPNALNLMDNPNLPVKEKFYSTDDDDITSSSESDYYSSYNSSTAADEEEEQDNDNDSYV